MPQSDEGRIYHHLGSLITQLKSRIQGNMVYTEDNKTFMQATRNLVDQIRTISDYTEPVTTAEDVQKLLAHSVTFKNERQNLYLRPNK